MRSTGAASFGLHAKTLQQNGDRTVADPNARPRAPFRLLSHLAIEKPRPDRIGYNALIRSEHVPKNWNTCYDV